MSIHLGPAIDRSTPLVAVTGAGSPAGRAIVEALARRVGRPGGPRAVVAVEAESPEAESPDVVLPPRAGVRRCTADLTRSTIAPMLRGARVVVHVAAPDDLAADLRLSATARRARAVRAVQEVAGAAAAAGAQRLVVVTSAMVYGARAGAPVPLPEAAPLAAERDEGVVGDLLEVERVVSRLPRVHPGLHATVVRPAALVGPGVDTMITRHFRASRLLALRGEQMLWQFCHVDDLGEAVAVAIERDLTGPLTVGCLPWLTSDDVERLTGLRRVELPARFAYAAAERLRRSGTLPTPSADLAYVVHPWVVGAERLLAAGWRPRHDGAVCVRVLRDAQAGELPPGSAGTRRVERREAALGAAGATVAILGTAALLRQARARRTGRRRPTL